MLYKLVLVIGKINNQKIQKKTLQNEQAVRPRNINNDLNQIQKE